jgi:hypothetical protein
MQVADKRLANQTARRQHPDSNEAEGLKSMTRRIAASITRALRADPAHERVHFHLDGDGRPFVCDVDRCESPALSLSEAERAS